MLSSIVALALVSAVVAQDPCAAIGGKKWTTPAKVRACYKSFKVDEAEKSNIIEAVTKVLAFHTSVNYQVQAPAPYEYVHEDILQDLERISGQPYDSDYDLHVDITRSVKRLNDGHCVWSNYCYDSAFINYLPIPLVLVDGKKVHIAAEAYDVASTEFQDHFSAWENIVSSQVHGGLKALNGAKVIAIDGADPFKAVNDNAQIVGGYQAFGTRQNAFFSSYQRSTGGWNYILGSFAQQSLPLSDTVTLLVKLQGSFRLQLVKIPYFSRIGSTTTPFTDGASFRNGNCKAVSGTNGASYYDEASAFGDESFPEPFARALQVPGVLSRKHAVNAILDSTPLQNVVLPPSRVPPQTPVEGFGIGEFYVLDDDTTGVLALGSFAGADFDEMIQGLYDGLVALKAAGVDRLIVDVTNNGGGYICVAHALHRLISGPKSSTIPTAGLNTTARAGPLAQAITQRIIDSPDVDPDLQLLYNPLYWYDAATNTPFNASDNWLYPPVEKTINGRADAFSRTLGSECPESDIFATPPPDSALFDGSKVAIISNGRCASSCSLFSIAMAKQEGSTTIVVGGKEDTPQSYCGTVGGQSTGFSTMDSHVKTVGLKDHELAPPDLIVNGVQGITWRLGYGIDDPSEPEEWQDRPANINLPLTLELANNPSELWKTVAELF